MGALPLRSVDRLSCRCQRIRVMAHSLLTPADPHRTAPEDLPGDVVAVYEGCQQARGPVAVAELAARQQLPTAVAAAMVADLACHGLVRLHPPAPTHSQEILERVLHGLRNL